MDLWSKNSIFKKKLIKWNWNKREGNETCIYDFIYECNS